MSGMKQAGRKLALRLKNAGTKAKRPARRSCSGFAMIVDCPKGWKPKKAGDVPPIGKAIRVDSQQSARIYSHFFNAREMQNPTGRWAVVVLV